MPKTEPETIYRPDRADRGEWPDYRSCNGFYLVTQGDSAVFAYNATYYPSAREVVADLIARRDPDSDGLEGTKYGSMDFAVWRDARIMAVVHQGFDCEVGSCETLFFSEPSNDPGSSGTLYGWPTREEWIAAGRPDVILLTPEDMERNRDREDAGKDIRSFPLGDEDEPIEEDED